MSCAYRSFARYPQFRHTFSNGSPVVSKTGDQEGSRRSLTPNRQDYPAMLPMRSGRVCEANDFRVFLKNIQSSGDPDTISIRATNPSPK
jgi:hypothetical protein